MRGALSDLIVFSIPATQLLQHMSAHYLFMQFSVIEHISLNLGVELRELGLVCVLIVDHVLEDQYLIVVDFIDGHFLEVLDDQAEIFPGVCEASLEALGQLFELYDHCGQLVAVLLTLGQALL